MNLFKLYKNFEKDEDGAVTVDWVVLTAALVGLGLAVIAAIRPGLNTAATNINTSLGAATAQGQAPLAGGTSSSTSSTSSTSTGG